MMFLYRLLAAVAILFLPLAALFSAKLRRGLKMRLERLKLPKFQTRPLWIHASSGEFEYAKALVRECKRRWPQLPVVVTYFSPTYAQSVSDFPGVDFACPLPLDLPGPCHSFLKRLNPRALLLSRTDFWPELLTQTRAKHIPVLVFSYTQKPVNHLSALQKWFTPWRMGLVDRVYCVAEEDRLEASKLGLAATVLGDTRYDQVEYRLAHPKELPEHLRPAAPCLVAGSTWSEDENELLEALAPLVKSGQLRLVLVPHEPTPGHIQSLQNQIERRGLRAGLYSSGTGNEPVLIVDKVGVLAELYAWGDLAFVGGSFRKSVHSVMEALGAGCSTLVGPYHLNNREALQFQQVLVDGVPALQAVANAAALRRQVEALLSDADRLFARRSQIRREFESRLGATQRLIQELSPLLDL